MAELGAIGMTLAVGASAARIPTYFTDNVAVFLKYNREGKLSGVIQNGAVVYENARVFLFYQPTMRLIQEVRSNALGEFTFTELAVGLNDYAILFKHPAINVNSVVLANLTPVAM